ncbi:hypothetical protein SAMN05444365_10164 [Micromonospora pattaloongensis]|uniref:Uncharacterized protein n=1 Tax=Micromonospora pattaloongensis TaxID=405436 RepID=A0A1H3FL03_9ACTN|nr:hypothetical protein [Micromonospora pattaloongensis]SDX91742.1 hypothetical protein SAMN05444365_10164 [Micromonospora pattaloongensis]
MEHAPLWARVVGWLGLAGHAFMLFWYAVSGLVAPSWAIVLLMMVWAGLLAVAVRLLRSRPLLVPLVPIAAAVIWIGALTAGQIWLNWTA